MRKSSLLTREQMEKLTTKRLMAYKSRLYKIHERDHPDYGNTPNHWFVTKESPEWKETVANAKAILAEREHVA